MPAISPLARALRANGSGDKTLGTTQRYSSVLCEQLFALRRSGS